MYGETVLSTYEPNPRRKSREKNAIFLDKSFPTEFNFPSSYDIYTCGLFLKNVLKYQFTFPPAIQEGFLFSTSSPAFIACRFFDDDHSDWCEVIPHCSIDLHFSNNEQ